MTADYYSKTAKKRAKETTTEQDILHKTKGDKRLHQQYKKSKTKSSIGGPRQTIGKQFQRGMSGAINKKQSKTTNTKEQAADTSGQRALRRRFTSPDVCMAEWMNTQQSNTRYCANHRKMTTNTTLGYNSGNGPFARSPAILKAFKSTLPAASCKRC
jgi:hypothetical protein